MDIGRKIRSALMHAFIGIYDAVIIVVLNALMWRNHAWNEKRWAPKRGAMEQTAGNVDEVSGIAATVNSEL